MAQLSTTEVDHWINTWPYNDISKKDSMLVWSEKLENAYKILKYKRAEAYANRFRGLHYDYNDRLDIAVKYYLNFLSIVKSYQNVSDEMSATSDLIFVYTTTNQSHLAKPLILKFTNWPNKKDLDQKKLSVFFNNLGIIYKKENKFDSAVVAYQSALKIKEQLKDEKGISNLRINLSSLYINQKKYREALFLCNQNIDYLIKKQNFSDLWYNYINKAGALDGLKDYQATLAELQKALGIAQKLDSKSYKLQTLEQIAYTYSNQKDFQRAFNFLRESNTLKSEILNQETTQKIAELQELHNADEREKQNLLLITQLQAQKNRQTAYLIGILALMGLISVIGFSYFKNKKKNQTIAVQNQKLIELNSEKNQLISVVSHDLSSPFTAIKMWISTLNEKSESKDILEAQSMILKTTEFGLNTIKKVLKIDKDEIKELQIEKVDLADLLKTLHENFDLEAKSKNIKLVFRALQDQEYIVTDPNLLYRALQNLLSNAVKFSNADSEVHLTVYENNQKIVFEVKDSGIGISAEELPKIFGKYNDLENKPTGNENSNGLGLSIVKRIAEELNATITVESTLNVGSTFYFTV